MQLLQEGAREEANDHQEGKGDAGECASEARGYLKEMVARAGKRVWEILWKRHRRKRW
jgi:hypothetical protein